ncbi:hypothetical protein FPQ18DRAFT_374227 [Pyronema domesticum]|uniref:Uncharacterized protein n=1 Tax=Pyronema omphalodes (strain CBS 100304) TaxID=1076935 RepID=U4L0V1_PYROM|nr:hypothetical protein FPQ18DRAFT_374227 [Pyronema domesticum]CCX09252.1 Protein of unknown function [Pyronema omphalodes CBS 100304]
MKFTAIALLSFTLLTSAAPSLEKRNMDICHFKDATVDGQLAINPAKPGVVKCCNTTPGKCIESSQCSASHPRQWCCPPWSRNLNGCSIFFGNPKSAGPRKCLARPFYNGLLACCKQIGGGRVTCVDGKGPVGGNCAGEFSQQYCCIAGPNRKQWNECQASYTLT